MAERVFALAGIVIDQGDSGRGLVRVTIDARIKPLFLEIFITQKNRNNNNQ